MRYYLMALALLACGCGSSRILPDDCSLTTPEGDKVLLSMSGKPIVLVWQSLTCPKRMEMAIEAAKTLRKFGDKIDLRFVYGEEAHTGVEAKFILDAMERCTPEMAGLCPIRDIGPSASLSERVSRCAQLARELPPVPWLIEDMDGPISALKKFPRSPRTVIIDGERRVLLYETLYPAAKVQALLSQMLEL